MAREYSAAALCVQGCHAQHLLLSKGGITIAGKNCTKRNLDPLYTCLYVLWAT